MLIPQNAAYGKSEAQFLSNFVNIQSSVFIKHGAGLIPAFHACYQGIKMLG